MKRAVLVILLLFAFTYLAQAREDITLTTFYPSPAGIFQELETTGDTHLATDGDSRVGIGTTAPTSKLEVDGDIRATGDICAFRGDDEEVCVGDLTIGDCYWGGGGAGARPYRASYDYRCAPGYVITGMRGIGWASRRFRIFNFRCCRITKDN